MVAAFFGGQLPVEDLAVVQRMRGAELHARAAAAVAVGLIFIGAVKTTVLLAGERQAEITVTAAEPLAAIPIINAALAVDVFQSGAMAIGGVACGDADHPRQGIGAVANGVGAAKDLDALNIFYGQWQVGPINGGQARSVD